MDGVGSRVAIADDEPDAPLHELQRRMRAGEAALAEELARRSGADGARWHAHAREQSRRPGRGLRQVTSPRSARTQTTTRACRAFASRSARRCFDFIVRDRVVAPTPATSVSPRRRRWRAPGPASCASRCPSRAGSSRRDECVDEVAAALVPFAGVPHRDPRAPQNLQPIGALEDRLRHLLGSPALAARAVRDAVSRLRDDSAASARSARRPRPSHERATHPQTALAAGRAGRRRKRTPWWVDLARRIDRRRARPGRRLGAEQHAPLPRRPRRRRDGPARRPGRSAADLAGRHRAAITTASWSRGWDRSRAPSFPPTRIGSRSTRTMPGVDHPPRRGADAAHATREAGSRPRRARVGARAPRAATATARCSSIRWSSRSRSGSTRTASRSWPTSRS